MGERTGKNLAALPTGNVTLPASPEGARRLRRPASVRAEQILDPRLEREGDLVEGRYRRGRLGALDLRKERDAEPRAPGHLLQREVLLFAEVSDRIADHLVQLLFGRARKALLAHDAREHLSEFVDVERFLYVVDGVELHRCDGRFEVRIPGEDDDREIGIDLADFLQHLDAVEMRHHHVQNQKVVAPLADFGFDLRRIAQRFDLVPVAFEQCLHVVADGSIIVDDEDSDGGKLDGHGSPPVGADWTGTTRLDYSTSITNSADGARGTDRILLLRVKLRPSGKCFEPMAPHPPGDRCHLARTVSADLGMLLRS